METLQPLSDFYKVIEEDPRIGATHISLYMALLHTWCLDQSENPFVVPRSKVMQEARISRKTYYKCIRELHRCGCIRYEPAARPFTNSRVSLIYGN